MIPNRPQPLSTLMASAQRLTNQEIKGGSFRKTVSQQWQEDAWDMYDLVGEERFLASTLAGRMAQAQLYVGTLAQDATDDPEPTTDEQLKTILETVGGSDAGRTQILRRLGVNLFIAGDGWLAGVPVTKMPDYDPAIDGSYPDITGDLIDGMSEATMDQLRWFMLSVDEVGFEASGKVTLKLDDTSKVTADPDDVFLIRVWRPHPRKSWEADSPTRSSLAVLRELVGLTMHISAQIDSRLAGAGVLLVPSSASRSINGSDPESENDEFTEALMEAMLTPINDRASASAVVPLVVTVPDDSIEKFKHLTFSKPLDSEARNLREEAIRRLALGQDAPPELLLGLGSSTHWSAWLVQEDVVSTHLEPPLSLICDALTVQYLRPMMLSLGYTPQQAEETVVWYDVSKLIVRPNRSSDADRLYSRGVISDEALRTSTGFDSGDAPETAKLGVVELTVLEMIKTDPTLVVTPGVQVLRDQVAALIDGTTIDQPPAVQPQIDMPADGGPPKEIADPAIGLPSA